MNEQIEDNFFSFLKKKFCSSTRKKKNSADIKRFLSGLHAGSDLITESDLVLAYTIRPALFGRGRSRSAELSGWGGTGRPWRRGGRRAEEGGASVLGVGLTGGVW